MVAVNASVYVERTGAHHRHVLDLISIHHNILIILFFILNLHPCAFFPLLLLLLLLFMTSFVVLSFSLVASADQLFSLWFLGLLIATMGPDKYYWACTLTL